MPDAMVVKKMQSQDTSLYDIYVIKKSGLPLFAGCTQSDYCKLHMDQHELQAGFMAALYSFSKETFTSSELKTILYDDIQLNFKVNDEKGLIFVFVHPVDADREIIYQMLEKTRSRFVDRYKAVLDDDLINEEIFESFRQDLLDIGIMKDENLTSTKMMQLPRDELKTKKPTLWQWLKSKLAWS